LGPGHYHLWKLGIWHRDISTGNLMYWRDENGHAYGKLSDFDLSSRKGQLSNNKQRTGTLLFMAIELLGARSPIVHKYEHDVESFYWVLLCAVLCAKDGRADCPMRDWGNLQMETLSKEKTYYISTPHGDPAFQPAEARQNDFSRFSEVLVAVEDMILNRQTVLRHLNRERPGTLNSEPNQQPEAIPHNVDEVYNMLDEARRKGSAKVPLAKVRPEISGRLGGHNSSMV
jgi:Fungal protein kinase